MISENFIDTRSLSLNSIKKSNYKNIEIQCKINCSRNFNRNLAGNDLASQYQRQKIIQNTVRVKSSLYTMNLGALNVYQKPKDVYSAVDISGNKYIVSPGVNWNQMSDRKEPHVQQFRSGSNSSSIWRKVGPGALSPGGSGVDILGGDGWMAKKSAARPGPAWQMYGI